jgi:peptide/nickel transport system permease protein
MPVVTLSALNVGANFGGAIITETVFGWNGTGWLVVTAAFIIGFNLIADILYGYLDPRIRLR